MLHIDMTLEDTRLIATRDTLPDGPTAAIDIPPWHVALHDDLSGKSWTTSVSDDALSAIVAIALAGDDTAQADALYAVAESALIGCPPECRPIP